MNTNRTPKGAGPPIWVPDPAELADLELLLDGAYPPLTGFLGAADTKSVFEHGQLVDGTPWPIPVLLRVPPDFSEYESVELHDPEGARLAAVRNASTWSDGVATYLSGPLTSLEGERCRSLGRLRPPAAAVRSALPDGPVLAVSPRRPLHRRGLGQIRHVAGELGASVLVLPRLVGPRPEAVVRAILAARPQLPRHTTIVPIPWKRRPGAEQNVLLIAQIAAAYGATHLLTDHPTDRSPIPTIAPPPMARDRRNRWRPTEWIPADQRQADLSEEELTALLDRGAALPQWFTTPRIAVHQKEAHPPLTGRGFTVVFTGLSGAGKSTLARELKDELALRDHRCVTLLDGDVVRRNLSEGLGFSAEDRSRNVRRIGWVAAEVTRHGGTAICAPIAPYAADRAEVRRMVGEVGGFVLVYVATPLEECERRDRKGLYASARSGELPEFTGVSAPYESPEDADLVLDTAKLTPEEAVVQIMDLLRAHGWVRPASGTEEETAHDH